MRSKFHLARRQRGFTLVEIVLVLAIVVLLVLGALTFFGDAGTAQQVNDATKSATFIQGKTKSSYRTSRNGYNGLNELVARQLKLVPQTYTAPACAAAAPGCLRNEFGTETSILPVTVDGTADRGFSLTYHRVPKNACPDLFTSLADGFAAVRIKAGSATAPTAAERTVATGDNVITAAAATGLLQNKNNPNPANQLASRAVMAGSCDTNTTSDMIFMSMN